MTLQFIEGFNALADYTERFSGYVGTGVELDTSVVRTGTQSIKFISLTGTNRLSIPTESKQQIVFGCAVRFTESLTNYTNYLDAFLHFRSNRDDIIGWVANTDAGLLAMGTKTGTSTYPLLGTSSSGLSINTWHYLEVKFTVSASTAENDLVIMVDDQEVLNIASGQDTNFGSVYINEVNFSSLHNSVETYYDDMYVLDSGGSINNDFLGDSQVGIIYPDGNGNYSQFVGSDGNSTDNYLLVDEAQHDSDATYVEQSGIGNRDSYTFQDLEGVIETIHGLSVCTASTKDVGQRTGKVFCRQLGVDYDGGEFGPASSGSYTVSEHIFETDPSTSSAWTETGVNAAEFGIKVHS
jgi:hypothetical protein